MATCYSFWTVVALTPIKYDAVAHTSNFIDILPLQKVSKEIVCQGILRVKTYS